jgi:hypothetical protein
MAMFGLTSPGSFKLVPLLRTRYRVHRYVTLNHKLTHTRFNRSITTNSPIQADRLLFKLFDHNTNNDLCELKRKYHELCIRYHPDRPDGNVIKFLEIRKAYEILNDKKKNDMYVNMTDQQHKDFEAKWTIEFHKHKKYIETLNQYIDNTKSVTGPQGLFQGIKKYMAIRMKSYYTGLVAWEEQKYKNETTKNNNRHIYFMLDVSSSMFCWNSSDPIIKRVPEEYRGEEWIDGELSTRVIVPSKYNHIVDRAKYVGKCMNNIADMLVFLEKVYNDSTIKQTYIASFMTFARKINIMVKFEKLSIFKDYIDAYKNKIGSFESNNNDSTHIYDALHQGITDVYKNGNLSATTFILFTDGIDYGSDCSLEQIINLIKDMKSVNIIIMTLNLTARETGDLRRIVNSAKFGKLLQIGSDLSNCGFNTIDKAFAETKNIIVSKELIQSNEFDVAKIFNL